MRTRITLAAASCALLSLLFVVLLSLAAEELREWTDSTGKFKIQATFAGLANGNVQLRKSDGSVIEVPLERLSATDRSLARKLSKQADATKAKSPKKRALGPAASSVRSLDEIELVPPDESTLRLLEQKKSIDTAWRTISAPASTSNTVQACAGSIPLASWPNADAERIDYGVIGMAVRPNSSEVILLRNFRVAGEDRLGLERCDIAAGKSLGVVPFPKGVIGMDTPPNLNRIVTWSRKRVDVWQWTDNDLLHVVGCRHLKNANAGPEISRAWLVDDDHLLVASLGSVVLWDLEQYKPVYVLSPFSAQMGLSPSRRMLAVAEAGQAKARLSMYEPNNGQLLGERPLPVSFSAFPFFSPDEKRLLAIYDQEALVLDIASGDTIFEFATLGSMSEARGAKNVVWPTPDHVLIDGRYLVDFKRGVVVWYYAEGSDCGVMAAGNYWYVHGEPRSGFVLAHAAIPHPEALRQIESAKPQPVLEPGSKIALQVDCNLSAEAKDGYTSFAQSVIKDAGFQLADQARLVLVVTVRPAKEVPEIFSAKFDVRYSLREMDKEVWNDSTSVAYVKDVRRPRSVAETIAVTQRSYIRMPRRLTRFSPGGIGRSIFTPTGISEPVK